MHIFAADIQAKDRNRKVPPGFVECRQFVTSDDFASPDAVGVVQHDVEGFDIGVGGQKIFGLGSN